MDVHEAGIPSDHIARARKLAPLLAAAAPRIDAARELPSDVLDAMHAEGMFRLLVPRSIGGAELDPATYIQCVEAIAGGDASVAWCMNQGSGCSMSAGYLDAGRRARSVRRQARCARLGHGTGREGDPRRGWLAHHRQLGVRQRQSPCELARRALPMLRGRRHAAAPSRRQAMGTHHAVPPRDRHDQGCLAGGGAARHRQRLLFGAGPVRR